MNGIYCKKYGRPHPPRKWFDSHSVVLTGNETFCYQPDEDKWCQLADVPFDDVIARNFADPGFSGMRSQTREL